MRYVKTVVDSFPAYDVILPRKCGLTGYPVFKDNDEIAVKFKAGNNYKLFTFGSVVSYALKSGDDPIESYNTAVERGHNTHWLNANCIVLSNYNSPKEEYYLVEIGDEILFEGIIFRVEKAFNDNLELVKVDTKSNILARY